MLYAYHISKSIQVISILHLFPHAFAGNKQRPVDFNCNKATFCVYFFYEFLKLIFFHVYIGENIKCRRIFVANARHVQAVCRRQIVVKKCKVFELHVHRRFAQLLLKFFQHIFVYIFVYAIFMLLF